MLNKGTISYPYNAFEEKIILPYHEFTTFYLVIGSKNVVNIDYVDEALTTMFEISIVGTSTVTEKGSVSLNSKHT